MKHVALILTALLLSGCSTLSKQLETRVLISAARDEVQAVSRWGPVRFGTVIADADAWAIIEAFKAADAAARAKSAAR